jgi:hypothetical protein
VRPGPKGHDDEYFKRVAEDYRRALIARPRAPVQMLLELYEDRFSEATIRRWLQRARDKGYLGAAPPGKAGERVTTKQTRRRR